MNRLHHLLLVPIALAALTTLSAQDGAKTAPRTDRAMVSTRVTGMPKLLQQWQASAVGKLAADPEVAEAAQTVIDWTQRGLARRNAIIAAAAELEDKLEPMQFTNIYTQPNIWRLFDHPLEQLRSAELLALMPDENFILPRAITKMTCLPRYEGRWTQAFDREAQRLAKSTWFVTQPDAKVGGFPAFAFRAPEDNKPRGRFDPGPVGVWMLHLPGTFVYGTSVPHDDDDLQPTNTIDEPEVVLSVDLQQYVDMFNRFGPQVPQEFALLGFDALKLFEWRLRFEGALVLDELEVQVSGKPTGMVGALLGGTAPLPAQALPKGAMAQARAAIDVEQMLTVIRELAGDELELTDALQKDLVAGLTGGIALGVTAPPPGGLIPRIYVSAGVADEQALRRALESAYAPGSTKQVTYDKVPCTLLKFDNVPQGLQPALCIHDGRLHIAESGRSLRALLKAQQDGATAMDVGDAPVPDGAGELLPTFDLRVDEVALYRAFRDIWLPIYTLAANNPSPLVRDDMPSVDVIAEYCGKSRGVLRRDGDRYRIQHLGVLGGPEIAALAMTWGPMVGAQAMHDYSIEAMSKEIAVHKLEAVWTALKAFKEKEQRWPKDLGELFVAGKLAPDALMIPGDDLAESVELPDGRTVRTSFRYFPEPVKLRAANANDGALLVEIRAKLWDRAVLNVQGLCPQVFGGDSNTPIDQIGR